MKFGCSMSGECVQQLPCSSLGYRYSEPPRMNRLSCQQLQDALTSAFPNRNLVVLKLISSRENSCVFLATTGTGLGERVAIKCCYQTGTSFPDEATATQQYLALVAVYRAFQAKGMDVLCVAEPVFFDRTLATYGMSWVEGQSLTECMRHCYSRKRVAASFELAGRWLGRFHGLGLIRCGSPNISAQVRHLEVMQEDPVKHVCFLEGASLLRSKGFALLSGVANMSWLHGDCKTDNFMFAGRDVFGIDVALAHENAVEMDLAMFLNDLDLRLLAPGFIHLAPLQADLRTAFLKGYGALGPSVELAFLQRLRLWFALTLWHSSIVEQQPRRLKRWYVNWVFSRLVRHLVRTDSMTQWHGSAVR